MYKMISPHHTSDSDVIYMAGLSGTQPVIYNMPDSTSIDTATGHVSFNAAGPQVTVMAIQVNEYRNGVLIGSVERDIELIFENCVNNLPTATGIDGTVSHIARVCANDPLSFFINSNDQDSAQLTQLSWDAGIPGATFYTSGTYRDTGYFYWLPDTQYISSLPYTFTLTVIDDACPNFGTNTYLYVVYVDSCNTTSAPVVANFVRDFSATYLQVNQSIRFRYILYTSDEAEVSLYDAVGRKVENTSIEKSTGVEREMTVNGLTNGVYLLTLKTGKGESKTVKVIIN